MSASLQDPPEHSRILQSSPPATPSQPWIKIIIGFTLGVICTLLLSTYLLAPSKPLQPDSRVGKWAESKNAEAVKSAPATGGTANPQESSGRTDASPPDDDSASRDAATTNAGDPCDKQTWPYVSHECAAAERTRNVRVIPTDKSAPTTIVTAAPTVTPPPPATDGQAPRQEPAPPAAGVSMPSSAPEPAPLPAPAPTPPTAPPAAAAPAPVTTAVTPAAPPVPPRPDPQAKPEVPAADSQTSVNRAAIAPPSAQEAQPSRKSRERRQARERRPRRDMEGRREIRETTGSSDVRYEEMSRSGEEPLRASRSRATDDDSRTVRSRTMEIDSDDVPLRSSPKRERRRIVVEEPEERNVVREERPRQRAPFPFFFRNGADND